MTPETTALIKAERYRAQSVTSKNILRYLSGEAEFTNARIEFDQHLHLPVFTPFLQELWDTRQKGNIFPTDNSNIQVPNQENDNQHQNLIAAITAQADVERARYIYFDFNDEQLKGTQIVQGDVTSVPIKLEDTFLEKTVTLTHVHTHPTSDFFSPIDFTQLLWGNGKDRFLRSVMLLGQDIQLLALSTPQTPSLPFELEAPKALIDQWDEKRTQNTQPFHEKLQSVFGSLLSSRDIYEKFVYQRLEPIARELMEKVDKGELTIEQADKIGIVQADKVVDKTRRQIDKRKSRLDKIVEQSMNQIARENNAIDISFARAMHLQLYYSTNMRDFVKFSA